MIALIIDDKKAHRFVGQTVTIGNLVAIERLIILKEALNTYVLRHTLDTRVSINACHKLYV